MVTCRYFSDNEKKLNHKEFQHLLVIDEVRKHSNEAHLEKAGLDGGKGFDRILELYALSSGLMQVQASYIKYIMTKVITKKLPDLCIQLLIFFC
jgi:hypothetical protein